MREKQIENKLTIEAKKLGGIAVKFVSPSFDGISEHLRLDGGFSNIIYNPKQL